jgi:hypothetical protein
MNLFQRFAAIYFLRMDRRIALDDTEDMLQKQTWYQNPKRYEDLFLVNEQWQQQEALTMAGRPVEEVVNDVDELDRYFDNLDNTRTMTGAELFGYDGGSGDWQ